MLTFTTIRISKRVSKKQLFVLIFLIALIIIFWSSSYFQDVFLNSVGAVEKYIQSHRAIGISVFIGLTALSAMLSPFSSVPLVPAAVLIWGTALTFLFLMTGWMLGGAAAYGIGRYLGFPIVSRIISSEKLDSWIHKIANQMEFYLVLLFRLATPSETGYIFGILRYHFWKYLLVTTLAELPYGIFIVYASEAFVNREKEIFFILAAIAVLMVGVLFYLFRKRLKQLTK
ncbi:MAG: VTT domain-containing protein [bacterium]|nr:VTT domain-containing protein [bacterium]